jgi:hypothetical protein
MLAFFFERSLPVLRLFAVWRFAFIDHFNSQKSAGAQCDPQDCWQGWLMQVWLCLDVVADVDNVWVNPSSLNDYLETHFSEARACIRPPGVASKSAGLPL